MDWKIFLLKFLRNIVVGTLLTTAILGLLGYLLGGEEGFDNMVRWGLILGLLGSISSGLAVLVSATYWSVDENYRYHPLWNWFVKKSGDDKKTDY